MTYRELQAILDQMDAAFDAAEAHGLLCGAMCARERFGAPEWLLELAQDAGATTAGTAPEAALQALCDDTREALESPDFAFAPLLPADDAALAERVAALASWCSGYLYGIGTAGASGAILKHVEVREFLDDLAGITRAELEPERDADAGEADYAELYEFVRAGAQLAWEELDGLRVSTLPAGAAVH
jgi:yecA family protein